jgi:dienelactone hydrolase
VLEKCAQPGRPSPNGRRARPAAPSPRDEPERAVDADPYRGAHRLRDRDQAAVDFTKELPTVDPERLVLLGQSAGGGGSLALASRAPAGVVAVVNFAGGRGSPKDGENCSPDALVRVAGSSAAV